MNSAYKVALASIFLIVAFSGCKEKCTDYTLGLYKQSNQLNGLESIIFYRPSGDLTFLGEGRYSPFVQTTDDPCRNVEIDYCIFKSSDENYKFRIHMIAGTDYHSATLTVFFKDYTYTENRYFGYKTVFNLPLEEEYLDPGQQYFDSLYIYDRYYFNVFSGEVVADMTKSKLDTIYPTTLYYNSSFGVLKVDWDDGSSWELKEILN